MPRPVKTIDRQARPGEDLIRGNVFRPPSAEENQAALEARGWHTSLNVHSAAGASLHDNPQGGSFVDIPPTRPKTVRRDPWRMPIRDFDDRKAQLLKDIREGR